MNLSVRTLSGLGTTGTGAKVDIGLFDADGAGNSTYSSQYNDEGTFANASAAGTYSAAQSGRVLINLTGAPVSYLIGPNAGFAIGTNAKVSFGSFEAQASGPFSDGSFSGTYIFGTESTVLQETTVGSGALTADGSGGAVDTEHTNSLQLGLGGETAAPSTYAIGANGVGASPAAGSPVQAYYAISPKKLVSFDVGTAVPWLITIEQ